MPRLIDADALEKRHCENCGEIAIEICKNDPVCATLMWLREEPTIDPESLRPHGRWVSVESKPYLIYKCSECGDVWSYGAMLNMNYCPNCGAKMDLEEEDN